MAALRLWFRGDTLPGYIELTDSEIAAGDGEEFGFRAGDWDWVFSWHPAALPPLCGTPHGSSAICITSDGDVVLVSQDGES